MRIVTYDEVDPRAVRQLCATAAGWDLPEDHIRKIRRVDPRCFDGFALYAVEDGKVVTQVIPFRMRVRLRSGEETVGAIAGVCSHPTRWGQGFARATMQRAHEWFLSEGLRLAALTTSRNIRGYRIYEKMGYVDLAPFYRAYRSVPGKRAHPSDLRFRQASRDDIPTIGRLFREYTRGLLGWTAREPSHIPSLIAGDPKLLERYRIVLRGDKPVGYFRTHPQEEVHMEELILPKIEDYREAVALAEARAPHGLANVNWVTARKDQERLQRLGYELDGPIPDATMALSLRGDVAPRSFLEEFGVPSGTFAQYPTEDF